MKFLLKKKSIYGIAVFLLLSVLVPVLFVSNVNMLEGLNSFFPDFVDYIKNSSDLDLNNLPHFCTFFGRIFYIGSGYAVYCLLAVLGIVCCIGYLLREESPNKTDRVQQAERTILVKTVSVLPFFLLFAVFFARHFSMELFGDDLSYATYGTWFDFGVIHNTLEWILIRYCSWTSRFFVEPSCILFFTLPHYFGIWKILDSIMIVGIAYMLSNLFKLNAAGNWILALLFVIYPFADLSTAGWCVTSFFYTYVLFSIVLAVFSLQKLITWKNGKFSYWIWYWLYIAGLCYGANQEQGLAILFGIHVLLVLWKLVSREKIQPVIFLGIIIPLIQLVFVVWSPGNSIRSAFECELVFPEYADFSLIRKLEIGFSSSMKRFILDNNWITVFFTAAITLAVSLKKKSCRAIIPAAITVLFTIINAKAGLFACDYLKPYGTLDFSDIKTLIPYAIYLAYIFGVLSCLKTLYDAGQTKTAFLTASLLILGLGSRIMMGLSPTVWASSERTFVFMYFSLICSTAALLSDINIFSSVQQHCSQQR